MASIFTYETEPVRLESPWPPPRQPKNVREGPEKLRELCGMKMPCIETLDGHDIARLEAEPQEGPIEYKLHLLLRARRNFTFTSTVQKVSGSHSSKSRPSDAFHNFDTISGTSSPGLAPRSKTRQNRLQHLTTQLLWRLQQSSPHHSSYKSGLVLPVLPDSDIAISASREPSPLVAGLEESQGALYEIGVSDDGTLVGLALDELDESLRVLRAMSNSIGCSLEILRTIVVGNCQWEEESVPYAKVNGHGREDLLWVAEVMVTPFLEPRHHGDRESGDVTSGCNGTDETAAVSSTNPKPQPVQLRVSLTGSTTSGKSSLLGTLSTSTLDNGRGKSRLSLLRHRHEIVSGVTSSLAQELIGYHAFHEPNGTGVTATMVTNYAAGNVTSWTDIHNCSDPGRLVFLTDSAGHPRFRRTTVRGLISWAPHWTFCCIAADGDEDSSGKIGATASSSDVLGAAEQTVNLSKAHMELCLRLDLPLVCVITKLDLASRNGLRQTVGKVLSTVKLSGRKPIVLAGTVPNAGVAESNKISTPDIGAVRKAIESVPVVERLLLVPIVLTSAVTGAGISQVHSLLCELPLISRMPTLKHNDRLQTRQPRVLSTVFHVDEIFAVGDSQRSQAPSQGDTRPRFVLSGYLRYGSLQTGDEILLGPFSYDSSATYTGPRQTYRSKSLPGLSKSLPKDLSAYAHDRSSTPPSYAPEHHARQNITAQKLWHSVRISSLRYLRLPARQLSEGQVGTVAISSSETLFTNAEPCLRRGMVICKPLHSVVPSSSPSTVVKHDCFPPAYKSITATFAQPNLYVNPGSTVTVYTASIRAPAKIVEVKLPEGANANADDDLFAFQDATQEAERRETGSRIEEIEITFRFVNSVEWVELGTKVLVTPASGISMLSPPPGEGVGESGTGGGGGAVAGLDGFVGRVIAALL